MYENIPDILTREDCQAVLKVGKNTMLEIINSGKIEVFQINGKRGWRITKEALIEYIQHCL